jgi:hypothetical protein
MQILIISRDDSRPQLATTAFLASAGIVETTITPTQLPLFDLDDCDCAIYIDPQADSQVINQLASCNSPPILVADQNIDGGSHRFIPYGILDKSMSVSIGIRAIREYLYTIPLNPSGTIFATSKPVENVDRTNNQRTPTIHQIHQARRELNFFESLSAG